MWLCKSSILLAASPHVGIAPQTTPIKYTPHMLNIKHFKWWDGKKPQYEPAYREKTWLRKSDDHSFQKSSRQLLLRRYSPAALKTALQMIPQGFEVCDVPRPPQRIRAQSQGVVGRWYTNYWTLHSIKYQCLLANIDWHHGERFRPRTNYDEPFAYVDFEETKQIRDYRSRWINVNRSLVAMTKRMKEAEEENRYLRYKKQQDTFWSNRKILINRVKAMYNQGAVNSTRDLPIKTMNIKAFATQ